MKRLIFAALAVALASCAGLAGLPDKPPAPFASTAIDEQAIVLAFEVADAMASQVDRMVASGQIVPGSPRALKVKAALVALRRWLPVASAAQKAGNATSYVEAAREAAKALRDATAALRG